MVTAFGAAVLAGVWAGRQAEPAPHPPPNAVRVVHAGPTEVGVPASWRPATLDEAGIPGLDPTRSTAFAPVSGRPSWAIATVAPVDHPSLISRRLRRLLGEPVPEARETRLGGRPAWAYGPVRTRSGDGVLEVTVQPTTRGVLTVACVSSAAKTTAGHGCASDISSTSVEGADALIPSPSLALALQLPGRLDGLDRARLAARAALPRADSSLEQARLARHLADEHRLAAKALRPYAGTADTSLVEALEAAGDAYASFASAAAEGPAAAFRAARRDVSSADSRLEGAVHAVVPRVTGAVRREAVFSAAAVESGPAGMTSRLLLVLALAGFGAAGLLLRMPRTSAVHAGAVASRRALAWATRARRPRRSRPTGTRALATRSARAGPVARARRVADGRPVLAPSATASPVQFLRRFRPANLPADAPRARAAIPPHAPPSRAGAAAPSALPRTRASAPASPAPAGDRLLDSQDPADGRPAAAEQLAGEPARGGWTCEIGWRAGLRSAAFRAVAGAPGAEPRLIAESPAVEWPPLVQPEPIGEVDDALRTLERRLTERGWAPVAGGPEWYRRRFSWTGPEAPGEIGTVEVAESGWSCEITWKAGLRGAGFRAVAQAAGEGEHVVARSSTLEWPPFVPPQPNSELVAAAVAVEGMLVEAGWRAVGRGPSWYARRFEWGLDGTPEPLDGVGARH